MAELRTKIISSDRFTFKNRVFVCEASDLGPNFTFVRIYDDAADAGFTMVSARTGKYANFYLVNTFRDGEGDVTHWLLKPTSEAIRRNPGLTGTEVHILND